MDQFLKHYFPNVKFLKKEKLPGDGGHRQYTRIQSDKETVMLMSCGKKDISLKNFIEIQQKLEPLVCVPKIFHKDLDQGFLLLEDLGDQSLEQFFFKNEAQLSLPLYHQALNQMISFQNKIKPLPSDPIFDKNFFLKETEMAISHLQTYLNCSCKNKVKPFNIKSSEFFTKDMEKILSNFKPGDYVYCHRDYHSRNLMLKNGQVIIIDFQDAGFAPWYYDLTSLLYDSYVPLSSSTKDQLAFFYFKNLPSSLNKKAISFNHIKHMTKLLFLQRGFKACGRFAAFKNLNQKSTHLKYIKPTLNLLKQTAHELSYTETHKYIQQMTDVLEELDISTH